MSARKKKAAPEAAPKRKMKMVMRVGTLDDDMDLEDMLYWRRRTMIDRLSAMQELREMWNGATQDRAHVPRSSIRVQRRKG